MAKTPRMQIDTNPSPQEDTAQRTRQSAAPAGAQGGTANASTKESVMARVTNLTRGHDYALLGGLAGLIVAILMFTVGFWQTLVIVLLVLVGVAVGQLIDGDPKIINFVRNLFEQESGN